MLLFSQVGLGFFHDKHDAHEHVDWSSRDQTQLHKHGEHCKLCSIDLFSSLFVESVDRLCEPVQDTSVSCPLNIGFDSISNSLSPGRAPPVYLS